VLTEQLQRALDYFIGTLVGAGTQSLSNKLLVFRPQSDGHRGPSFSLQHFHRTPAPDSGQACELLVIRGGATMLRRLRTREGPARLVGMALAAGVQSSVPLVPRRSSKAAG